MSGVQTKRSRSHAGRRRFSQGFTLIEILVTVGILAMVSMILYGSFRETLDTQVRVQKSQERWHVLRIGLARMSRELSQAYVSLNENMAAKERRTYFVSKRDFAIDELTFSSFSHRRLIAESNESDQCLIRYYGAPDPDDPSVMNLMRRETRRIQNLPFEEIPGEAYVLIPDVEAVHYQFYDKVNDQWLEEWDTTSMDGQPNRLPHRVRIYVTVIDERGEELTLLTEGLTVLRDALNLAPPTAGGSYGRMGSGGSQRTGLGRSSVRTSGTPRTRAPTGRGVVK
jgi:general secretion pathway protein J